MFPKTKTKKILSYAALLTIMFFIVIIPSFVFAADAAKPLTFQQNIQIGNTAASTGEVDPNTLGTYLQSIYRYAIGAVGILATVVMMFGGVMWITSGGNNERVSDAKAWIGASITGLVLALSSYTILYLINPNVLTFRPIDLKEPDKIVDNTDKCQECTLAKQDECENNDCCRWVPSGDGGNCYSIRTEECGKIQNVNTICKEKSAGCQPGLGETFFSANCSNPSQICCQTDDPSIYCGNNEGICMECPITLGIHDCTASCASGWERKYPDICGTNYICCGPN